MFLCVRIFGCERVNTMTAASGRFAFFFFLSLAAPALAQGPQYGSIVGQVQVVRGWFPPNPVLVTLTTHGTTVASIYSDNEGRFGFYGLVANPYQVNINEPDYAPINVRVDLNPAGGAVRMLNITLVPKGEVAKPKSDENRPPVSGSNPNVTSAAGLNRNVPDAAIREFKAGVEAERKKKVDEARQHYRKAIQLAPDFSEARNNLGSLALSHSDFSTAREQFQAAMRSNPSEATSYFNLANVSVLTRQPAEAANLAREGLRLQPGSAFGHFILGTALANSGDAVQAERELKRALELDASMTKAHLALVNIYLQQRNRNNAIAELKAFLQSSPHDPFAPKAREVLKRLEEQK